MATTGGHPLTLIWIHMSTSGLNIDNVRQQVQEKMDGNPHLKGLVSINFKDDGSEILVKVNAEPSWVDTWPQGLKDKVIQTFTEENHSEAVQLVKDPLWEPVEL